MTLIELIVAVVLVIVLINFPSFIWVFILVAIVYGGYHFVTFCQRHPSLWQMRRAVGRKDHASEAEIDSDGKLKEPK